VFDERIVLRGGGDLGSGVAVRLVRAGFSVVVLEAERPLAVRRTVAFAEAVYEGVTRVEEVIGKRVDVDEIPRALTRCGVVPVAIDPQALTVRDLRPYAVVDAIMAKRNTGTGLDMASCVVGLGPGFNAGRDVHAVVETNRGPHLGRVIWDGQAAPNTGEPAPVGGHTTSRVLRAPQDGVVRNCRCIGDIVEGGEIVATVGEAPVHAPFRGLLRGLSQDGLRDAAGLTIGDVDPRLDPRNSYPVSDKSLAVAGGVLDAFMKSLRVQGPEPIG